MSAVTPCPSLPSLVDIYLRVDELGLSCKQPDTQTRAGASIAMGKGGHVSQYLDRGDTITNPPPSLLSSVLQLYWRCQDTAVRSLRCCHGLSKYGLSKYLLFERVLLNGQITGTDADGLDSYPELDIARLAVQLAMFKSQFSYQTLHETKARLQAMTPEVRTVFSEVEQLVRLMLLCPVSSCEAERSFSCLRRLKTWLRSTMTQQRLNFIIVCHVNQEVLDSLPISAITAEFAGRSDIQRSVFGNGPFWLDVGSNQAWGKWFFC